MVILKNLHIRQRMLLFFLLTGIIPLVLTGYLGTKMAGAALTKKSLEQMEAIQSIRGDQIKEGLQERLRTLQFLSQYESLNNLFDSLKGRISLPGMTSLQDMSPEAYRLLTVHSNQLLIDFLESYKYRDFFLIDGESGQVLFTANRGKALGTSLIKGKYSDSGLARLWKRVMEEKDTILVDFSAFEADGNNQSAFMGTPLYSSDGRLKGLAALQIDTAFITELMDSRQGMGESGESYLLHWNRQDNTFALRSRIFSMDLDIGYSPKENLVYWDDAVKTGMAGGSGIYADSIGNKVLATYNALNFRDLDWFLVSKIDLGEILQPLQRLVNNFLMTGGIIIILVILIALGIARNLTVPILQSKDFAWDIAHGELTEKLNFVNRKDELGELGESLNLMSRNLREIDWLKTGKEGLDDALRGEWELKDLCSRFISFFVKHLDARMGAMYMKQEDGDILELTASYAFTDREGNFNRIPFGEGLVGQAALEKEPIYFTNLTEGTPPLNYGAAEKIPPYFLLAPLLYENRTLGVFLIASLTPFSEIQRKFVSQNSGNAAILINTAKSRELINALLQNAQEQQEELRVINEELESQTQALKESEEELQAQQEELRVTNEELEERTQALEEKTDSITHKNDALMKAQREIEKKARDLEIASKYKSEFLANMSHELRTPLNSILILSQLFSNNKDGNLTEKQIESAGAIYSSGSDLLKLINEILDLSKVEAGKIELTPENMPFEAIITDLKRVFQDTAEEKKIHFDIIKSPDIPETVYTDPHRLQQVLRNLLTNALKFTSPEGSVRLRIERPTEETARKCQLETDRAVAFHVEDNGIGIPEDKQAAIFEAFQQADGSTSRKYGGTGLGLSISRELAKLLGGNLLLESEEEKGSTFSIIIPLTYTPPAEKDQPEQPELVKTEPAPSAVVQHVPEPGNGLIPENSEIQDDRQALSPGDKSLLIIEDDPRFIRILKDLAREKGFKCLVAEDGETGLHFADYYKPKAIILDIGLPGIDGWTVMERLKDNPALRHIPVHFMSGSDDTMEALKMGAIGFLTKPVTLETLNGAFSKIEQLISRTVKKLLIVEDNAVQRESIRQLIADDDIQAESVGTGREAFEKLSSESWDCMVLDLGLEDMSGFELLEKIRKDEKSARIPVIIYTGRDLAREEDEQLRKYSNSIIIKGAKSPERLLDETALFLHRVESEMPLDKQNMLKKMHHNQDAVFRSKKILLVDDDMRNVFALSSILEEKEMEVLVAKNGLESLKQLEEEEDIQLVLMDIMMPEMDGYEAMRRIRKIPRYKKLPIIALTAKAMKGDRSKCIESGASDYLAKPVETDKLLSMMKVWLYK